MNRRDFIKFGAAMSAAPVWCAAAEPEGQPRQATGAAMAPASPFNHAYHQTLTIKLFLASPVDHSRDITFAETLEIIGKIRNLTRGIPLIVYLVGWQYEGHDSKYPAWDEVNVRLKRPEDARAVDSLRWLMKEARDRYGATVSLHTNMCIGSKDSPLWAEYETADLWCKDADGKPTEAGEFGGHTTYHVCNAREWASGHAKARIDRLLEMLPVQEAGTIHLDFFRPNASPYHGVDDAQAFEALRAILRYWHSRGVDVTTEWFHHELAGLLPMVWHLNLDEVHRMQYPVSMICGGGSLWNARRGRGDDWMRRNPEEGCLYPHAWGQSMYGEMTVSADPKGLAGFLGEFCLKTLPWHFLNQRRMVQHVVTPTTYEVHFDDDLRTCVNTLDEGFTITHQGRLLQIDADICMPATWLERECIAFSGTGGVREWTLPPEWKGVAKVAVRELTLDGIRGAGEVPVREGRISLSLAPGQGVSIVPA